MIHCLADERLEKLASVAHGKKKQDMTWKFEKKGFIWLPAEEAVVYRCSAAKSYFLHH